MLNDRLRVLYGWRNQNFDNSFVNNRTGAQTSDSGWADASIRYGGSFRITDSISFFGSFSERNDGAVTTLRYPAGLHPTDPRIGETISASASIQSRDIGIKGRLLDDRIYYSLAYFKINRTGTTNNRSLDQETLQGAASSLLLQSLFIRTAIPSMGGNLSSSATSPIGFPSSGQSEPKMPGGRIEPRWTTRMIPCPYASIPIGIRTFSSSTT